MMGGDFGISAGVQGLLGGLTGAAGSYYGNQMASSATGEAQNWSQIMRATAYQTAVKDMRRAGLNPILAAGGMGAAGTPGAPSQQVFAPSFDVDVEKAVTSGLAVKTARDQAATVAANRRTAEATAKRAGFEADAAYYAGPTALQRLLNIVQDRDLTNAQTRQAMAMLENIQADTAWTRSRDWATRAGIPYSEEQIRATQPMIDLLSKPGNALRAAGKEVRGAVGNFISSGKAASDIFNEAVRRGRARRAAEYEAEDQGD